MKRCDEHGHFHFTFCINIKQVRAGVGAAVNDSVAQCSHFIGNSARDPLFEERERMLEPDAVVGQWLLAQFRCQC